MTAFSFSRKIFLKLKARFDRAVQVCFCGQFVLSFERKLDINTLQLCTLVLDSELKKKGEV